MMSMKSLRCFSNSLISASSESMPLYRMSSGPTWLALSPNSMSLPSPTTMPPLCLLDRYLLLRNFMKNIFLSAKYAVPTVAGKNKKVMTPSQTLTSPGVVTAIIMYIHRYAKTLHVAVTKNTRKCLILRTSPSGITYTQRPMITNKLKGSAAYNGAWTEVTSLEAVTDNLNNRQ